MKRILLLFTALIVCVIASSCAIPPYLNNSKEYDPSNIEFDIFSFGKEKTSEIIKYFDENDSEALKKMFSEELASTSNIDTQIQNAMEYYEGKCVSHDESSEKEGSAAFYEDHYTYRRIIIEMDNIVTDKGRTYRIVFYYTLINDADPPQIGIHHLRFLDEKGVPILTIDPDGGKNITQEEPPSSTG